ncbi:MAG: cation transporter [Rhodoferax sp.]|nr:cation transporter [Pseudorhodobacter sp.]
MAQYTISGMTCAGCARKVEAALKVVVPSATVTLDPPVASVTGAAMDTLNTALSTIGKYRLSAFAPAYVPPAELQTSALKTYFPLFLVLCLIALAAFAGGTWMISFMAGFFLVFGAFKLLDVPAFADAYSTYDVVAKRFRPWGMAYPFVETALGFAFLFQFQMHAATWVALVLSLVGAIGVIQSVMRKQTIKCACLGTVFNLPMSTITIVENLGMAAMAVAMLAMGV